MIALANTKNISALSRARNLCRVNSNNSIRMFVRSTSHNVRPYVASRHNDTCTAIRLSICVTFFICIKYTDFKPIRSELSVNENQWFFDTNTKYSLCWCRLIHQHQIRLILPLTFMGTLKLLYFC